MADTIIEGGISITRHNLESYFKTHDVQYIREDAVFRNLSTGEVTNGRQAIGEMLQHIYHVAFDAKLENMKYMITEDKALLEGTFVGKHIGEINGIPATNKMVNVPLAVSYDLEKGLIKEARIYMLVHIMMEQISK